MTIKINGSSDEKVYNGSAQISVTTVTPSCDDSLFDESKFSYTGATTITETNVGVYTEAIDTTKAAYSDANLDVTFVAGTSVAFKITKKPVTITINGSSDEKVYNGSAQTSETTVTPSCSDSLFDASKFSYTGATTITETNAGEYTEAIDITKASYDDANLDVTFVAGTPVTFNITKKAVTITINGSSDEKVYNGSAQTSATTVTPSCDDELFDESKFNYTGAKTITETNVGEYSEAIDTTKASYSDTNLNVTFVAGTPVTFKITPATMTLEVNNYSDTYDGQSHTVTVTPSVTEGTTLYYSEDGEEWSTEVPTWTNFTNGAKTVHVKAENPNYETVTGEGTVTINKAKITLTGSNTVTYNGQEQKLELSAADATGVVSGETLGFQRTPTVKGTDAGTYVGIYNSATGESDKIDLGTWYVTKANDDDSTDNYEIEVTGTLIINKAKITITVNGSSDKQTYRQPVRR